MKLLLTALILVTIWTQAHANGDHTPPPDPAPVVTNTTTNTTVDLPSGSTYGLLALATSGNQLDWGVPDKLQLSFAGAFTEGGNQAVAVGLGTRFGGVLFNAHFATTINAEDHEDDYAFVFGGTMHF